jgi:hypothetical protein
MVKLHFSKNKFDCKQPGTFSDVAVLFLACAIEGETSMKNA